MGKTKPKRKGEGGRRRAGKEEGNHRKRQRGDPSPYSVISRDNKVNANSLPTEEFKTFSSLVLPSLFWCAVASAMSDSAALGSIPHQAPLSVGCSRQAYWSGLPFPSPGDLPDLGIEAGPPALQADSLPSEPPGKPLFLGVVKTCHTLPASQGTFTFPSHSSATRRGGSLCPDRDSFLLPFPLSSGREDLLTVWASEQGTSETNALLSRSGGLEPRGSAG